MTKASLTLIIIISILSVILPIAAVILINRKHKLKLWVSIVAPVAFILVVNLSGCLIYFVIHYHAMSEVNAYLEDDNEVKVSDTSNYYFFDNLVNSDKALIFYGGAKVEEKSYAPMMSKIAHQGIDVFIVKMPLRFPLFNPMKAESVYKANNNYQEVYMMGHSLGGVCASRVLNNTSNEYKGIIFLASYSDKPMNNKYKALSIYGSEDKVINLNAYSNNISHFPTGYVEHVIEGANHANYGYYGNQKGDGKATITREAQIDQTVSYVSKFIGL